MAAEHSSLLSETAKSLAELYNYLPDACFFAKDGEGRFVVANELFVQLCGKQEEGEVLGKTDFDFFDADLSESYRKDDALVMAGKGPLINQMELVATDAGDVTWMITTKVALRDNQGDICGVAGITRDMDRTKDVLKPFTQMECVIAYIRDNFRDKIEVSQLAEQAQLSISQFERNFKRTFNLSPIEYVNRVRIFAACRELVDGERPIGEIAKRNGFYDNAYFTRQFVKWRGLSPSQYRAAQANSDRKESA